jgi:hypothetical protein
LLIVLALAGLSTTTTFMEYLFRNAQREVAQHGEAVMRCQCRQRAVSRTLS